MNLFCLLLSCLLLVSGCAGSSIPSAAPVPQDISLFSFSLPEGYDFQPSGTDTLTILKDGSPIGAVVLTDLDPSCTEDTGNPAVHQYLNSYGPVPLICEYIIMQGDDFLSVSMAVTDPERNIRTETFHHLFSQEGRCFDLWFDIGQSSEEDHDLIMDSILVRK